MRLGQVPFIDATGMQSLWDLRDTCIRNHTRLVLCETRANVLEKLKKAGFAGQLGEANIIDSLAQLKHANPESSQ